MPLGDMLGMFATIASLLCLNSLQKGCSCISGQVHVTLAQRSDSTEACKFNEELSWSSRPAFHQQHVSGKWN